MICATEDHLSSSSPKAYRTREARMPENLEVGILRTSRLTLRRIIQLSDTIRQLHVAIRQLRDTIRKLRDVSKIPINYPSQLHSSDQQKEDNQQQAKSGHFSATSSTMNKDIGFMSPSMALCPDWQQIEHSILHYNPNGMESLRIAPPYYDVPCKFCTFKKKNCLKSTKIQAKLDDMIWYTQNGKEEKFLEIAIDSSNQQKEILRTLLNITDANGFTALDLFYKHSKEVDNDIENLLLAPGALRAKRLSSGIWLPLHHVIGRRQLPTIVDELTLALMVLGSNLMGKKEKLLEETKVLINYPLRLHSSNQQKEDNQQQAKSGHFSTTSGKMNEDLGFVSPCMPLFRAFEHQKILHKHSMQEKLTSPAFPRDDDASCRLAGMIVLLVASLLRLNVEHLLLSTPLLFIWLMLVFIWLGIVSGISVVLLWLLRLPKKQSLLLLIAILSTIGSYACAIAVVLPFEWLRAPFLAVAISGLSFYVFVQLKKGKLPL